MSRIYLIGLGHRARNGKDSVAEFIRQEKENVIIYHFADPLKEEVMNKDRKHPLIMRIKMDNKYWYNIWSKGREYTIVDETEVPFLHNIFEKRNIDTYWGMNGNGNDEHKDSLMLQFWGTNWRRERYGNDYWINKVEQYFIENCLNKKFDNNVYFLLPDTRFKNEVNWIRHQKKYENVIPCYLKVLRFHDQDGTPYFDNSRDRNHPSEIDLEGVESDYTIGAISGDMDSLRHKTQEFLKYLDTL